MNEVGESGYTPLMHASLVGDPAIVSALLQAGADPNCAGDGGVTPLIVVAAFSASFACANLLLERGARANDADVNRGTPLIYAAANGHAEITALLCDHGADVNQTDVKGFSPLAAASANGKADIVDLLLSRDAAFDSRDELGFTPLMQAAFRGFSDVVQRLLRAGADCNAATFGGTTALHLAGKRGFPNVLRLLLNSGANPNVRDPGGRTALIYASTRGHKRSAEILRSFGADSTLEAADGKEPLKAIELPPVHRKSRGAERSKRPARPLMWRFSSRRFLDGVDVAHLGFFRSQDKESSFSKVEGALRLVARMAPSVHRYMVQNTLSLWVIPNVSYGSYLWKYDLCVLDAEWVTSETTSRAEVASTIVHEATHARLWHLGFGYSGSERVRVERACQKAQFAFHSALPGPEAPGSFTYATSNLLTDSAHVERMITKIREIGVPAWFGRFAEWWLRRSSINRFPG